MVVLQCSNVARRWTGARQREMGGAYQNPSREEEGGHIIVPQNISSHSYLDQLVSVTSSRSSSSCSLCWDPTLLITHGQPQNPRNVRLIFRFCLQDKAAFSLKTTLGFETSSSHIFLFWLMEIQNQAQSKFDDAKKLQIIQVLASDDRV